MCPFTSNKPFRLAERQHTLGAFFVYMPQNAPFFCVENGMFSFLRTNPINQYSLVIVDMYIFCFLFHLMPCYLYCQVKKLMVPKSFS